MAKQTVDLIGQKLDLHIEQNKEDFGDFKDNQKCTDEKVTLMMTNHLPHLKEDINKLDKKLYGMGVVITVLAPIIYFILQQFLGKMFK